jgi:hypothetical protein
MQALTESHPDSPDAGDRQEEDGLDQIETQLDAGIDIEAALTDADALSSLLQKLWAQIPTLPLHQRKALLLNFPGWDIRRLPDLKIARFEEIAALEHNPCLL